MRRRLFNIASAVSLLLSLAAAIQWTVTFLNGEIYGEIYYVEVFNVAIGFGDKLTFMDGRLYPTAQAFVGRTDARWASWQIARQTRTVRFSGITWETGHLLDEMISNGSVDAHDNGTYRLLSVNPWLIVVIGMILPMRWFWIRRHSWHTEGLCRVCGYNLSANTSGVCPECGTAISVNMGSLR